MGILLLTSATCFLVLAFTALDSSDQAVFPDAASVAVELKWISTMVARMSGQSAASLRAIINAENFSTRSRGLGMAVASIFGCLGGGLGPLFFVIFPRIPFMVLSVS